MAIPVSAIKCSCIYVPALVATTHPFTHESDSIQTLKELVRHNHSYTLTPELSVLRELDNPMVKCFAAPEPVREISLVVHQGFVWLPLLTSLRDIIIGKVCERLRAGKSIQKIGGNSKQQHSTYSLLKETRRLCIILIAPEKSSALRKCGFSLSRSVRKHLAAYATVNLLRVGS